MGNREANVDSTNLPLMKVGRSGKVVVATKENKKDEDAVAFKRLMARMQEEVGPGGYLHGRGALDHDDILYLKEQQQAEHEAERLRKHTEKRAFAAFKAAASNADLSPSSGVIVESKSKRGIRQNTLLKSLVEVKAKKPRIVPIKSGTQTPDQSDSDHSPAVKSMSSSPPNESDASHHSRDHRQQHQPQQNQKQKQTHQPRTDDASACDSGAASAAAAASEASDSLGLAKESQDSHSAPVQKAPDGISLLGLPYDGSDDEEEEGENGTARSKSD